MFDHLSRRAVVGTGLLGGVALAAPVTGRVATLRMGDPLPRFDLLRPGLRSYLISSEQHGIHAALSIWQRTVRFDERDGKRELVIDQHWDGVGPGAGFVERQSRFAFGTFRPSSHTRISEKDGKRTVEGFLFRDRDIVGLPGLADNIRTDFNVPSAEPMYNFETDMEMLQTLPWARDYAVSIPFFHPAPSSVPARYLWRVVGTERLAGPDGRAIECWVVACDYNQPDRIARFWLAKGTHQLVKQEAIGPDGAVHRKTLLW